MELIALVNARGQSFLGHVEHYAGTQLKNLIAIISTSENADCICLDKLVHISRLGNTSSNIP